MSWKSLAAMVLVLAFATFLVAQDNQAKPFIGVWSLNLEKSASNAPFDSQTITNVPIPGGYLSTRSQVGKDNKNSSTEVHPVIFDGKPHRTSGGDPKDVTYKLTDSNTFERTLDRNGKISMDKTQVSKDGKTMIISGMAAGDRVYDKKFEVRELGK